MKRDAVSSSSLSSVGYDATLRILEVEFRHGGIYQYLDVPPEVYTALREANSLGGYLGRVIKPNHVFRRVE